MSEAHEVVELELTPIPPDTIDSTKEELVSLIETTLREAQRADLLSDEHIHLQIEKTFPTDAAIIVGFTLLSGIALETYKELILPMLKRQFEVRQRARRGKASKREE
jgi:hypothetical protein